MMTSYVAAPGDVVDSGSLRTAKGHDLAQRVRRGDLPYAFFVEGRDVRHPGSRVDG